MARGFHGKDICRYEAGGTCCKYGDSKREYEDHEDGKSKGEGSGSHMFPRVILGSLMYGCTMQGYAEGGIMVCEKDISKALFFKSF